MSFEFVELPIEKKYVSTKNFMGFKITYISLNLNISADITVELYNMVDTGLPNVLPMKNTVETLTLRLEGEDYNNWGDDDSYIINYIQNYLMNMPDANA